MPGKWAILCPLGNLKLKLLQVVSENKTMLFDSGVFNPIALRKAKTVFSFGLSECNRVKIHFCSNFAIK